VKCCWLVAFYHFKYLEDTICSSHLLYTLFLKAPSIRHGSVATVEARQVVAIPDYHVVVAGMDWKLGAFT
jgi:hypothetical protein